MTSISDRLLSALGGSYTIERELTGGGMALVFLGEDHDLGRKVVIKILPPELAASVSAERFRREILTVARLQHPHIVPILKAGEVDGLPYFVMPYVDGESIDVKLRRSRTLSVRETLGIMKDVARALAFAHEHGVVHRDIKPGNVLPPPPLSTIRKDVPAGLECLIARCLAIDPADRPQTATALVEALEDPDTISGSFASAGPKIARHGTRVKRAVIGATARSSQSIARSVNVG